MKKIISLIAAGAMALGLIGCSGDLHDDVLSPVNLTGDFLVGSMQSWSNSDDSIKFVAKSGASYTYEATFTAKFSEGKQTVDFAILPTKGSWNGQIGGDKMAAGTLPTGVTFESTDNGNGGRNGTLKGLTESSVYKMTVETSTGTLKISLAESKEPAYFLLDGYYIRSLGASWNAEAAYLLWNPTKDTATGDVTYTVQFTATATTQQLAIARAKWDDGRYECSAATEFAVDTGSVNLESGKEEHPKVTGLTENRPYNVIVTTKTDKTVSMKVETVKYVDITAITVKNVPSSVTDGKKIYFLDGTLLGTTDWTAAATTTATLSSETATYTLGTAKRMTSDTIGCQIVYIKDGETEFGDSWVNVVKLADDKKTVSNPKTFVSKTLVFDCSTGAYTLE